MRDSALSQREASPQVVSEAKDNMASFVLANGSVSLNQSGEGDIRRSPIEADLVDTVVRDSAIPQGGTTPQVMSAAKNNMVALTGQLFYSTQIPVCLWLLAKNKAAEAKRRARRLKASLAACRIRLNSPHKRELVNHHRCIVHLKTHNRVRLPFG